MLHRGKDSNLADKTNIQKAVLYCGGGKSVKEKSLEFSCDPETSLILNKSVSLSGFYNVFLNNTYEVF